MSFDVNVLVRGPLDLATLAGELSRFLNVAMSPVTDNGKLRYEGHVAGIAVTAYDDHGLEDDSGIPFSRFPVVVSFVRYAGLPSPALRDQLCQTLALLSAEALFVGAKCECLVVAGMQRVVGAFPQGASPGEST